MTHLRGAHSRPAPRLRSQRKRRTPGMTRTRGRAARPPRGARWSCSWRCSLGHGGLLRTENKRRSQKVSQRVLYRVTRTTVCSHSLSQRQQSCRNVGLSESAEKLGFYWFCMWVNRHSNIIGFSESKRSKRLHRSCGVFSYSDAKSDSQFFVFFLTASWPLYETEILN